MGRLPNEYNKYSKKNDYMPILKTTICSEVSTRRKHYGLETSEPVQKPILNTLYYNGE